MIAPLTTLSPQKLRGVRAVLTDIDGTLTTQGRLPAVAYAALERLRDAGLLVIPVTGRPAGWCDLIARQWPVAAVIGENGAFYFAYDDASKVMHRVYAQDLETRNRNKTKLWQVAGEVLALFPGTAMASDQAYREIDVAIDFCEDVPALPKLVAQDIAAEFHKSGVTAKVSSIHVNAWFGTHDKHSMAMRLLHEKFGIEASDAPHCVAYCGDSPNDAPMFAAFPMAIGVANVLPFVAMMEHLPAYVTIGEGGVGFAEFAELLLAAKKAEHV